MTRRETPVEIVADVTRRMQAILAVFDDDLERLEAIMLPSLGDVVLPPSEWKAAHHARERVAESLRSLEENADAAVRNAADWRRRAEIAEGEGRVEMAQQARKRGDIAGAESLVYRTEAEVVRDFLREWDARVRPAG
jgi:hypothetical protein